jgi:tetratricopeptide (TPR) repeat protein
LLAFGGDRAEAIRNYRSALGHFEGLAAMDPRDLRRQEDLMSAVRQIGFAQFETGDLAAAAGSFRRYLQIAEGLQAIDAAGGKPPNAAIRRDVAAGYDHLGEILSKSGEREQGIANIRKSLGIYQELFDADRENPAARRSVIAAEEVLGDALLAAGRSSEAIDMYHRALDLLEVQLKQDPQNVQAQRDVTVALGRMADALIGAGRQTSARPVTERALKMLAPLVNAPQPSEMDLQQYAWIRVTTPFADLRDAAAALRCAQKAVAITNGTDPAMLDLLARAMAASENFTGAVETEQKALALLPAGSQSDLRSEIEANLARFRSKTARPTPASK